jgi:hypothetical protein
VGIPGFLGFDWNAVRHIYDINIFKIKNYQKGMKEKFLAKKGVTWFFAAVAVVSGFIFLDSSPTGNVILNRQSPVSLVSIIGLLLIACSAILIAYSAKKK